MPREWYYVWNSYGITDVDYHRMLAEQDGGCAICKRSNLSGKRLYIDHDHNSGAVRGLLCSNCNLGIGHLQDAPEVLSAALAYLLQHQKQ